MYNIFPTQCTRSKVTNDPQTTKDQIEREIYRKITVESSTSSHNITEKKLDLFPSSNQFVVRFRKSDRQNLHEY